MKGTALAALAVAAGVMAPAQVATAAPHEPKAPAPYDTTFSTGRTAAGGDRAWSTTTRGEWAVLPYEKDGLVHHEVAGFDRWNSLESTPMDEKDPQRHVLGVQDDDQTDWIYRGCPDTAELAGPATFTSADKSFIWKVGPDYDPFQDPGDEPVPGTYHRATTHTLGKDVRSVSVEASGCVVDPGEFDATYAHTTTHFVRTADGEFTKVATSVRGSTGNEGGYGQAFHAEPGWEFLEKLSEQTRPEGLTDAQWADQLVAEGVLPADRRWYVANTEPTDGPIVDTGYVSQENVRPATIALAGIALLGAGGATLVGARRR